MGQGEVTLRFWEREREKNTKIFLFSFYIKKKTKSKTLFNKKTINILLIKKIFFFF
jgi:hypothetical protein